MEGSNSFSTAHLGEDMPTAFRDPLLPSHPIEDLQETSRDGQGAGPVSAIEEEATFPNAKTELLRPTPATLDEREEQLEEVKDCDNASVMEQADRIEQMNMESKDPKLSKPIRSYLDESLPDLLRSGSPLRRRVSSPVSDTVRYQVYTSTALDHIYII